MAKILTTAIVADIRNKLNGSVFSKNRYGAYVRTKVTPVNPQTESQQDARNRLSTFSQAWRGLTESQRQGWIDAAQNYPITDIYGNQKILSGSALFVRLNVNLAGVGVSQISDAPSPVALPALESLSVAADDSANTVIVTFTPTPVAADFALVFQATGNVTPGKSFVKNLYRTITFADAADTSPQDISAAWTAIHGDPVEGQKVFIKAFFVSKTTGQAGIPQLAQTVVVA